MEINGKNISEMSFPELREAYNDTPKTGKNLKILQALEDEAETRFGIDMFEGQTPSEQMTGAEIRKDIGMSAASGAVRGTAGAVDAPSTLLDAGAAGIAKVTGGDPTAIREGALESIGGVPVVGSALRGYVENPNASQLAQKVAPGLVDYEPKTTAGEMTQRVTEFVPFSGKKVVSQGVMPALASYVAGNIEGIEGTGAQLPVEIATAILTPFVAKKVISPRGGDITGETKKALDILKKEGVIPTAGQTYDDDVIMAWEDATKAGRDLGQTAYEQFSRAALKRIGINAAYASAEDLERVYREMGQVFNETIDSIDTTARKIVPSNKQMDSVVETLEAYSGEVNPGQAAPIFRQLFAAFKASNQTGQSLSANQIKRFHETINSMTRRGTTDGDYAREILPVIKEMINDHLGKEGAAAWKAVNGRYRDFLAIERTLKSGDGLYTGLVVPNKLASATQQVFNRSNLFGKSDLGELAKAGGQVMKRLPQSGTQPRIAAQGGMASQDATRFGAGAFGYTGDPQAAAMAAAAGTLIPPVRNAAVASAPGQAYLRNQLIDEFSGPMTLMRMLGASTLPNQ